MLDGLVKMPPALTVAQSWDEFDRLIQESAVEVEFRTLEEEREYERADWRLHAQLCSVLGVQDRPTRYDKLVYVLEDWYPTKTKFIEADILVIGLVEVMSLYSLLTGEFADWRINVQLYRGFDAMPAEHIGGLNIYADRVLIQADVNALMQIRGDAA